MPNVYDTVAAAHGGGEAPDPTSLRAMAAVMAAGSGENTAIADYVGSRSDSRARCRIDWHDEWRVDDYR